MSLRFIAVLDILGFSSLIRQRPLAEVQASIQAALDRAKECVDRANDPQAYGTEVDKVRFFSFSDTFVLVSGSDNEVGVTPFLAAVTVLTRQLFAQRLPVRGAITYGEVSFLERSDHALGKGILRAFELEKDQKWLGVYVDERVMPDSWRTEMDYPFWKPLFLRWKVLTKGHAISADLAENALVLNWRFNLVVELGTRSLFEWSDDSCAREKISETLRFAQHVRQSKQAYLGPAHADVETPMWIEMIYSSDRPAGAGFSHGDTDH